MVLCTVFTSAAQVLYKIGASMLPEIFTNLHLIAGLALYGIGALLLVTAFRFGEVTLLYPIIATSYIWVSILSFFLFSENIGIFRWVGISLIIFGIILISSGSRKNAVVDYVDVV